MVHKTLEVLVKVEPFALQRPQVVASRVHDLPGGIPLAVHGVDSHLGSFRFSMPSTSRTAGDSLESPSTDR